MNFDDFVKKYNGKATDYDGGCGVQCVDLAKLYMDKVLGIKIGAIGNAEAYWNRYNELSILNKYFDRILNTPNFIPQRGDIVVWGLKHGKYGHIAIADGVGTTSYFYSYDQNWHGKAMKRVKHTYKDGFEGVLRPQRQDLVNSAKFAQGQAVEVHIQIKQTGAKKDGNLLVESDTVQNKEGSKQFWIHESVIKNNEIVARAIVCWAETERVLVQVFEDQFWIKNNNIAKVL